jgi:hypothetical protein
MSHFVHSSADWSAPSEPVEELLLVGWCETVSLPGLGIESVVAKLDTGAVVSSLHATQIEYFTKKRTDWVRFRTTDMGTHTNSEVRCEARLLNKRSIRSSNGSVELRPVVETSLYLGGFEWTIELSLNDRSQLECPLLLGRSALQSRCLIDCSRRFVLSSRIS